MTQIQKKQGFFRVNQKKSPQTMSPFLFKQVSYQLLILSYQIMIKSSDVSTSKIQNPLMFLKLITTRHLIDPYHFFKTSTLLDYYYINNFKFLNFYEQTIHFFLKKSTLINSFKHNSFIFKVNKSRASLEKSPAHSTKYLINSLMSKFFKNKLKKLKSRRIFKNKLLLLTHMKLLYNANSTLKLKHSSSVFTIPPFQQLTIDFFQFTNSAPQLGPFIALKLIKNFKINLFNLTNISNYFNWENLLPSSFSFKFKSNTYYGKVLPDFLTNLIRNASLIKNKNSTIFKHNEDSYKKALSLRNFSVFNLKKLTKFNTNSFKKTYLNKDFFFNKFEFFLFFFFNPIFFKYNMISLQNNPFFNKSDSRFFKIYNFLFQKTLTYSKSKKYFNNNLFYNEEFNYVFKKTILKALDYSKFGTTTLVWHYNLLIRFLEYCSGKKVYFRIHPFLQNHLTFSEKIQCVAWSQKVKYFRRVLGPRLFLNESLQILYLSFKFHDPFLLSNWMASILKKISFWKSKTFLRYIKYVVKYFFWAHFKQLKIEGIKYQLKGKISVAGNSRTRTAFHTVGSTSHSTFNNKILFNLNLVKTFTGVLGLKLWIVF